MSLTVYQNVNGELREIAPGFRLEDNLARAVMISLFTDRRAEPYDALPDTGGDPPDRRGWWADAFQEAGRDARPIGSRLWLLERSVLSRETLRRAEDYAREALAWIVADGAAGAVTVAVAQPRHGWLGLDVAFDTPEGRREFAFETQLMVA